MPRLRCEKFEAIAISLKACGKDAIAVPEVPPKPARQLQHPAYTELAHPVQPRVPRGRIAKSPSVVAGFA